MENLILEETKIEIEYPNWIPFSLPQYDNRYRAFHQEGEPIVVHIIKTGYENTYIVTIEDGYDMAYFESNIRTKQEIKDGFGIDLDI
jgi:hypothetical protein